MQASKRKNYKNNLLFIVFAATLSGGLSGCAVIDYPDRLEALERRQTEMAETLSETRQQLSSVAKRQDDMEERVEKWLSALSRTPPSAGVASAAPRPRPSAISEGDRYVFVSGGAKPATLFANNAERVAKVNVSRGPSGHTDSAVVLRTVVEAGAGQLEANPMEVASLADSRVMTVPCGGKLEATAAIGILLFSSVEFGEPCSLVRAASMTIR